MDYSRTISLLPKSLNYDSVIESIKQTFLSTYRGFKLMFKSVTDKGSTVKRIQIEVVFINSRTGITRI